MKEGISSYQTRREAEDIPVTIITSFLITYLLNLLAALGLHCCAGFLWLWLAGATLRCGVQASHCGGFSCCRAQALGVWASVAVACGISSCGIRALERRFSSCGVRA